MKKEMLKPLAAGLVVALLAMLISVRISLAAPAGATRQERSSLLEQAVVKYPADIVVLHGASQLADGSHQDMAEETCGACHLDIANTWAESPHSHAYDDTVFQERWVGLGSPGSCLSCHTTNYVASSNSYTSEGVSCEACHGPTSANHPPQAAVNKADTEYCGSCHTTTLQEWKITGHATAGMGCTSCHDPHSQASLFEVKDELCLNCHVGEMGDYLEDTHIQKGIGCVDCHALVIPPDPLPVDGVVPTGHSFTITTETCVACHTDTLHSGFSLPGYEHGAAAVSNGITVTQTLSETVAPTAVVDESGLTHEQQIQALETALASNQLTTLFQGGFIGLVLGSTTAWLVAHNTRRTLVAKEEEPEAPESENKEGPDGEEQA